MNLRYYPRQQWGASQSLPRLGVKVEPSTRTSVHIHHTAGPNQGALTLPQALRYMRQLQTMRPDLGLDVPYSFAVAILTDGTLAIFEGRGLERSSAHTKGSQWLPAGEPRYNLSGVSFGVMGEHETHASAWDRQAMATLGEWIGNLRRKYFPRLGTVRPQNGRDAFGHRDSDPVGKPHCPGQYLYRHLAEITLAIPPPAPSPPPPPYYQDKETDVYKLGDRGTSIATYQNILAGVARRTGKPEMHPGSADGVYGPQTETAVRALQAYVPLEITGMIDMATSGALWTYVHTHALEGILNSQGQVIGTTGRVW